MSVNLTIFDPEAAPRTTKAFQDWHWQQTNWIKGYDYNNPDGLVPGLRQLFFEMIQTFPPMNGSLANKEIDDAKVTDYSLGSHFIYTSFAWSEAELAVRKTFELASKYQVGFFDEVSENAGIWFPNGQGKLIKLRESTLKGFFARFLSQRSPR